MDGQNMKIVNDVKKSVVYKPQKHHTLPETLLFTLAFGATPFQDFQWTHSAILIKIS